MNSPNLQLNNRAAGLGLLEVPLFPLVLFSIGMAVFVPLLFLLRLVQWRLRAHHLVSILAWMAYIYVLYEELVVEQAF